MYLLCLYPPEPVVNVPCYIGLRKEESKYIYEFQTSQIKSIQWFIDDQPIVTSPTTSPSLIKKLFSSSSLTFTFTPQNEHVGKTISVKVAVKSKELEILKTTEFEFKGGVIKTFVKRDEHILDSSRDQSKSIRVVTFNIMADIFTHPDRFDCEPYVLYRPYRQYILPEYILDKQGDLVLCQEVEVGLTRLVQVMSKAGYGHTQILSPPDRQSEQCLTFYRESRFNVLYQYLVNYNTILLPNTELLTPYQIDYLKENEVINKLLSELTATTHHNRHNILALEDKQTNQKFILVNVHLYWGAMVHEVNFKLQLLQVYILSIIIQNLMKDLGHDAFETPIIWAGDCNSGPADKTYEFFRYGAVDFEWNGKSTRLEHPFKLISSYSQHPNGEPAFTGYTKYFKSCIDQIWISNPEIKVQALLEVEKYYNEPLPTITEASDHILLYADLLIKK